MGLSVSISYRYDNHIAYNVGLYSPVIIIIAGFLKLCSEWNTCVLHTVHYIDSMLPTVFLRECVNATGLLTRDVITLHF